MPQINLTAPSDYDSQMLAISRQQKLAEMLSQMGAQEIPVSSAGGISAPISPMAALAKGLTSFGGSYLAGQAENKAKDYENSKLSDALMAKMAGSGIDPNTLSSATNTTPEQPGFFDRAANFLGMGGNQEKPAIAGPAAPANTPTAPIDAEGTPTGTYMLPPTPASAPQPKNDAEGTPTSSYMPSQQPASPNAAPMLPYLAKLDQQERYYTAYKPTTLQGRIDQQTGLIGIQQNRKNYLDNLPRYQALLAAAPPENRPQLQAAINTNNTALLDKYEGTQLDKSTPNAPNAMDAKRLEAFKQSNADRVAHGKKPETIDEYNNRLDVNKAVNIKAGEWGSIKKEIDYRTQKQIESFHEKYDLPPEDMSLIDAAVVDNRIDFSKLNSRTARYYAQLLKIDPNADLTSNAGVAALKKSPLFQQKVMVAATIPQMLTNLENITNKLNYNDIKAVGGIQNWWKQQNNDPTLAEYGPLRSDLILKITSAMRGVGMSDKATELESVVNSPTMSPQAIAGYVRGQMASIKPMLQEFAPVTARTGAYENIEGMNVTRGTKMPGSPAQGGAAAPGAGGGATQRHMLNNREIVPNTTNTGWVYKDTGGEAK